MNTNEKSATRRCLPLFGIVGTAAILAACGTGNNSGTTGGGATSSGGASTGGANSTGGHASSNGATTGGGSTGGGGTSASGGGASSSGNATSGGASSGHASTGSASTGASSTSGGGGDGGGMQWLGTWSASPYPVPSGNQPPSPLSNAVLRQVVHVSLGGSTLRFQFSNLSGDGPVTINAAHIALCKASPAVDGSIDTTTDTALMFSGKASVTIAAGMEIWSDPVAFALPALGNVSITTAFGAVPNTLTGHAGSRTTSYEQTSSTTVTTANMTTAPSVVSWYYISGMEVMADPSKTAIVAMGDSLTDGRGTDNDKNNRWTDDLEVRLQGNAPTSNVAMLNMGIGGSTLVGTMGTAAQARFSRDVLGQAGVHYVIIFDGVNDIGGDAVFTTMMPVYASLIDQAHKAGMLIYGATITPFGTNTGTGGYYSMAHEMVRQQVNAYIRTAGVFDGVLDFDAAVTDGGTPPALQTQYDTWAQTDGLHLNPAGYQKLADSVDLTLFAK